MLFRYILKQLKSSPVRVGLFILFIALTGIFLNLGAGLFVAAEKTVRTTDKLYTTIAIPNYGAIKAYANAHPINTATGEEDPSMPPYFAENKIRKDLAEMIFESGDIEADIRDYFSAYSPDVTALTPDVNDPSSYMQEMDSPSDTAAFIISVNSLELRRFNSVLLTSVILEGWEQHTTASVKVEEVINMHSGYPIPDELSLWTDLLNADGSSILEPGKRYLVICAYSPAISGSNSSGSIITCDKTKKLASDLLIDEKPVFAEMPDVESGGYYTCFELDGSLEDALNGGRGGEIRAALEIAEKSIHSLRVMTTDNIYSILQFNTGDATMLDGRTFTAEETALGAKVCIISAGLAGQNGFEIGDEIPLQFYEALSQEYISPPADSRSLNFYSTQPYSPNSRELPGESYKIVGIYRNAQWENGLYEFSPNTVFVPDKAFSGFTGESELVFLEGWHGVPPFTYSCIVENGKVDEFKAVIDTLMQGYSDFFLFYDQGYSAVGGAVANLSRNSLMVFVICAAAWIAAVILFALLYIRPKKSEAGILSAVGIGNKFRRRSLFMNCLAVILCAQIISCAASFILYRTVLDYAGERAAVEAAYENAAEEVGDETAPIQLKTEQNPSVVLLFTAGQTVVFLIVSFAAASSLSRISPLKLLHSKEG